MYLFGAPVQFLQQVNPETMLLQVAPVKAGSLEWYAREALLKRLGSVNAVRGEFFQEPGVRYSRSPDGAYNRVQAGSEGYSSAEYALLYGSWEVPGKENTFITSLYPLSKLAGNEA